MRWQDQLGRWPLLIAALSCIGAGLSFGIAAEDTEEARAFLLALGAVLMGAWIALLAAHDYQGHDTGEPPSRDSEDSSP